MKRTTSNSSSEKGLNDESSSDLEASEKKIEAEPSNAPDNTDTLSSSEIESEEEEGSIIQEDTPSTTNKDILNQNNNIIETKELLQFRRDNVVYFVSSNGEPCDDGAKGLLKTNKIPAKQDANIGTIIESKRSNNRHLFALCIRRDAPVSQAITITQISKTLMLLRGTLIQKNLKEFSIAKSTQIDNVDWPEVLSLIIEIFKGTGIKTIICKGTLKYVPEDKRNEIFSELHNSPVGGHKGVSKTFHRIRQQYYWENLKQDIQRRIQQCLSCQLKKLFRLKTKQKMIITDTPGTTLDKLAMDIVGPLPKTKNGNEYILTMQDQLSKYCLGVPLPNALASTIADAFVKRYIRIFGAPRIVLTDQGRNFLSSPMKRIAKRIKIKQVKTTAFHPQSNGSLERSHHALGEFLKQYSEKDCEWDQWVEIAMLNYNTSVQESTKHTPFEVIFCHVW